MDKSLVIIPAAGYANRLRPISKSVSNAMIPVNGKPIISFILDELKKIHSIHKIVIVVNEYGDVEHFVKQTFNGDLPISFVTQTTQKGPLDAVRLGFDSIGDDYLDVSNVLIWLGDTIYLEDPVNDESDLNTSFVLTSNVKDYRRWCMYDEQSKTLIDKPIKNPNVNTALIGIYNFADAWVFNHALKQGLNEPIINGAFQISSLIHWYENIAGGSIQYLNVDKQWHDCGELHSYYETRSRLLNKSARSFNNIEVDTFLNIVTKTAKDKDKIEKIEKEKYWFAELNNSGITSVKCFIPQTFQSTYGELKMSLEPGTPLNEIWLYDNLSADTWITIIDKILKVQNTVFKQRYGSYDSIVHDSNKLMYLDKNLNRIQKYKNTKDFDLVEKFIQETGDILIDRNNNQSKKHWSTVFHGDGHIGNIIYEPTSGNIKFIDPRGEFGYTEFIGDMRYDMGKLLHDFYCGYPNILGNQYEVKNQEINLFWDTQKIKEIQKFMFNKLEEYGYDINQLKRLAIMLILTCLPFHSDDPNRQQAFWARGIQLIKQDFNHGQ